MAVEIKMPQLGQTSDEVRLIKWLIKEGDEVKRGQPLCEVETDKVTMELESIESGKVTKLLAAIDSQIKTGEVIATIQKVEQKQQSSGLKGQSAGMVKPDTTSQLKKETDQADVQSDTSSISAASTAGKQVNKYSQAMPALPGKLETDRMISLSLKQKQKILSEIGSQKAIAIYKRMLEIREFEERIKLLFLEGKMPGTIHQYIGQEACAVGVCAALEQDDVIASTHRPHGHAIARGVGLNEMMAELYGKTTGCCKGKGGSMHVGDLDKGVLPAIAIVGGNIPIIGGMALAFKIKKEPRVAVSFFGDGASNEGAFHEGLNMAAIYELPALFVCENNLYGASTSIRLTLKLENIAQRVCAYGMRGDIGDGMDVLDVYSRAKKALDIARVGGGPTLLELKTFRLCGHSRRDPCNYMEKDERQDWAKKDPIILFESFLLSEGVFDKNSLEAVKKEVNDKIDAAVIFGQTSPDPKPEDTYQDLYINMEVPR